MTRQIGGDEAPRHCGECQACCQCLAIAELNKPVFNACPHQCAAGCGIYAGRPGSCRSFRCLWLMGFLSREDRPDLLGVIFVTTAHPELGNIPMLIELKPGAMRRGPVQAAIGQMRQNRAVVVMTGQTKHVLRQLRPPRTSRRMQLARMTDGLETTSVSG